MKSAMRDLIDLIYILDRLCSKGPDKILLKKIVASKLGPGDAYILGHSAGLLEVLKFLKDEKVGVPKKS